MRNGSDTPHFAVARAGKHSAVPSRGRAGSKFSHQLPRGVAHCLPHRQLRFWVADQTAPLSGPDDGTCARVRGRAQGKSEPIVGEWKNTAGEAFSDPCPQMPWGLRVVQTQLVCSEPSGSSGDIFSPPGDGGIECWGLIHSALVPSQVATIPWGQREQSSPPSPAPPSS